MKRTYIRKKPHKKLIEGSNKRNLVCFECRTSVCHNPKHKKHVVFWQLPSRRNKRRWEQMRAELRKRKARHALFLNKEDARKASPRYGWEYR